MPTGLCLLTSMSACDAPSLSSFFRASVPSLSCQIIGFLSFVRKVSEGQKGRFSPATSVSQAWATPAPAVRSTCTACSASATVRTTKTSGHPMTSCTGHCCVCSRRRGTGTGSSRRRRCCSCCGGRRVQVRCRMVAGGRLGGPYRQATASAPPIAAVRINRWDAQLLDAQQRGAMRGGRCGEVSAGQ